MGLSRSAALFLLGELRRGVSFSRCLVLGRQSIVMPRQEYEKVCSFLQLRPGQKSSFADDFFIGLGAKRLSFLDASTYEGADFIHDLNQPISDSLSENWSCVVDGGTLEHVFNFPEAIKNAMRLVEEGGHLILITPWNNFAGHGFYQFSPELFYRVFSERNGFEIERMLVYRKGHWFSVGDPDLLGERVEMTESARVELHICARRKKIEEIFLQWPQQSDYSKSWESYNKTANSSPRLAGRLKEWLLKRFKCLEVLQMFWRMKCFDRRNQLSRANWARPVPQKNKIPLPLY